MAAVGDAELHNDRLRNYVRLNRSTVHPCRVPRRDDRTSREGAAEVLGESEIRFRLACESSITSPLKSASQASRFAGR